jgi:hypothetical protein
MEVRNFGKFIFTINLCRFQTGAMEGGDNGGER